MPSKTRYQCDCADFTKSITFLVNTQAFSKSYTRSWQDSSAGVDAGQFCKHIWATKLSRGEVGPEDVPNDIPIPISQSQLEAGSGYKEIYQPGYLGHSFSPRNRSGFGIPRFRPHRGA